MADPDKSSVRPSQEAEHLRGLEGLEAVRLRPGMYIPGLRPEAVYYMAYEVLDASINESMAGHCSLIEITIHPDTSITISDNGRGIPVAFDKAAGISILEAILTDTMYGNDRFHYTYRVCGGMHGLGLKAVNALSERMIVEIRRDGFLWRQSYARGVRTSDLEKVRPMASTESTGTSITFRPDFELIHEIPDEFDFGFDRLSYYCRELAFVLPRITIHLLDQRRKGLPHEATFYYEGGLEAFVNRLNEGRIPLHRIVSGGKTVRVDRDDQRYEMIEVEFALQYTGDSHNTELGFVNAVETLDGGTHLSALWIALATTLNRWARKTGFVLDKKVTERGAREGLTAVVSIKHSHPEFESQVKVKLVNPEVRGIVASVVSEYFTKQLESDPDIARRILDNFRRQKANG